jgi:alkaline phosphatase D
MRAFRPPMDSTRRHILDLSRRGLLRGSLALAALAALRPAMREGLAQPRFGADPFSLGVASGDPWPDSVVLWTRLAPAPLEEGGGMPPQAVEVGWEVAEDDDFRRILRRGTAIARPEAAHAVHVEADGLPAGRPFLYRFHAGGVASPVGRTRTAPAPDAAPGRLRFVNAGCQHYEQGLFTAWRHVAEEPDLDLVVHYGDYIYEYAATSRANAIRRHVGGETMRLDDYRARHALYRLDPDLAAAHAAHPFLVTFDDHEVDNDWAGPWSEEDGTRGRGIVPPEVFLLRRAAAFQAWFEHMPLRAAARPRGPDIVAHRRLRWGRLADLHLLDTRQYRDDQPCGGAVSAPCEILARPEAQMLGAAQEAWLLRNLEDRHAAWQVLAQQVMLMPRDLGDEARGAMLSMDKWDGYPAARARLLAGLRERAVRNAVVLSGDIHSAWAGTLHDAAGTALATEFVATSISSGGDGSEVLRATPTVLRRNPHIGFFNNRRGYALHEVTPARMQVGFRAVDSVSRSGVPLVEKGRLVVESGRAAILGA